MVKLTSTRFFIGSTLLLVQKTLAFSPSDMMLRRLLSATIEKQQMKTISLSQSFVSFADNTEPKNLQPAEQFDANGKAFSPGVIVAIAPNARVKAHQVSKDAYGSFDPDNRNFIPADETNSSRSTSCLILSEGIRGEVTKVYNVNEWDRAHPILVEFKEGVDRDDGDGFIVPKSFAMHFSANEIIVVD